MPVSCTRPRFMLGSVSNIGWFWIGLSILFGSATGLITKAMTLRPPVAPCEGCEPVSFNHPFMQALMMFIGEFCCGVYWIMKKIFSKKSTYQQMEGQSKQAFKWYHMFSFAVPTVCDLVSSVFSNIGVALCLVSVYSLLRNANVIFVAMFSLFFKDYRGKFDLPQLLGLVILFTGLVLTGIISVLKPNDADTASNPTLGMICTLISTVFQALFYFTEEIFIRKLDIEGSLGVCIEGGWGILFSLIVIPAVNKWELNPGQPIENVKGWVRAMASSGAMVGLQIAYVLAILVFNLSGFETTKTTSGSARTTFGCLRPLIIWILSFCFLWESWDNLETPIKFIGFVTVVVGVLIYNNIWIVIPYLRSKNIQTYQRRYVQEIKLQVTRGEEENALAADGWE